MARTEVRGSSYRALKVTVQSLDCIFFLIFYCKYLLYSIVLVSAIHQHESVTGVHVSLPLESPSHLPPLGYQLHFKCGGKPLKSVKQGSDTI